MFIRRHGLYIRGFFTPRLQNTPNSRMNTLAAQYAKVRTKSASKRSISCSNRVWALYGANSVATAKHCAFESWLAPQNSAIESLISVLSLKNTGQSKSIKRTHEPPDYQAGLAPTWCAHIGFTPHIQISYPKDEAITKKNAHSWFTLQLYITKEVALITVTLAICISHMLLTLLPLV